MFQDFDSMIAAIKTEVYDYVLPTVVGQMKEALTDVIDDVVYKPFHPHSYERQEYNGGFIGSWKFDEESYGTYKIYSDPATMTFNPVKHIHGRISKKRGTIDRRDIMDQLIDTGKGYDFYVVKDTVQWRKRGLGENDNWWTRPRDYITPFNERMVVAQKFYKFVNETFEGDGVTLKASGGRLLGNI